MTPTPGPHDRVDAARAALERGQWPQAYELLRQAEAAQHLDGAGHALLAQVAYGTGHLDVTIESWEAAHAQALQAGDPVSAAGAAVRVAMHLLFDTALMAPVRGWLGRAQRLLQDVGETPVHAWIAVVRSYERLLSGEFASALQWARQALDIGARLDPAAAAVARIAEARCVILSGDVSQGLALLNESAVACVSGELDPLFTGLVYCEVVCAFQALAQYDQAEEWTTAMERWSRGRPIGSLHGRCRVHRAEILRLRGGLVAAEDEALLACDELRPYLRRELGWPLTELGRIRLLRGDLQGAQDVFGAAHEAGWDAQPGLALVQLALGDVAAAARAIEDALAHPLHVPSKEFPPNSDLRRVRLLEAQVTIAIASGDTTLARAAATELTRLATHFQSKALIASAALACGKLARAEGELAAARTELERALRLWNEIGAPCEAALTRMELGQVDRAEGHEDRAMLQFRSARSGFDQVAAIAMAAEAARSCDLAGVGPAAVGRHAAQPPSGQADEAGADDQRFQREGDIWCIAFNGRTVRLRDLKGLHHLARLLAHPGRDVHVLELVGADMGGGAAVEGGEALLGDAQAQLSVTMGWDAGVLLDDKAKAAYRRRLAEVEEDREAAWATGNAGRAAQADAERDFLLHELAAAVGLGGRDRRAASSSERARASVTRAIRHAIARVGDQHPAMAEHLQRTVRTGTSCAYLPDPRVAARWRV